MFCRFVCYLSTLSLYHYLLTVVQSQTSQAIKHCYNMREENKKYSDDECDKIDFMDIVQSIGSQIKVCIDSGTEGKIPQPHPLMYLFIY